MRRLSCLQPLPTLSQFALMQFRPCLHKPLLSTRQLTTYPLYWVNAVYCCMVLVIHVEVGNMVGHARLHIHADDDTEEAGKFRQGSTPQFCIIISLNDL